MLFLRYPNILNKYYAPFPLLQLSRLFVSVRKTQNKLNQLVRILFTEYFSYIFKSYKNLVVFCFCRCFAVLCKSDICYSSVILKNDSLNITLILQLVDSLGKIRSGKIKIAVKLAQSEQLGIGFSAIICVIAQKTPVSLALSPSIILYCLGCAENLPSAIISLIILLSIILLLYISHSSSHTTCENQSFLNQVNYLLTR